MSRDDSPASTTEGDTIALVPDVDASLTDTERGPEAPSPLGDVPRLGRYVVIDKVGAGTMGVVARAYDARLRREVALKRVKLRGRRRREPDAEARLLREARALARLNHPNVLTVYDVEEIDGTIVVATELVEGDQLDAWLRARPRSLREIVSVMIQAARGLAAAHDAGLVHRDFKPANVIVGSDDRVRVMDFGLAREFGGSTTTSIGDDVPEPRAARSSIRTADPLLTAIGTVVGTPAYMAPEQHGGATIDARSDQYAYCVTLWEALWGRRPFSGRDLQAIARAKADGPPTPPSRPRVPTWLRRVVLRGLTPAPDGRFASMRALLLELERGRARSRRRVTTASIAGVALIVGGIFVARRVELAQRVAQCEAEGDRIAEVWNDETRAALRTAWSQTGIAYAKVSAERVMPWLDAHAASWHDASTNACMDATVHGTWDADTVERARWCLDERRMELDATVRELVRGGAKSAERAVQAAVGLSSVAPCRDAAMLLRLPAPPEAHREDIVELRGELSRASAMEAAAAYDDALLIARDALAQAKTLDWPPLVAAARRRVGSLLRHIADFEAAEAALEEAYFEAARVGEIEVAYAAAEDLVHTVGPGRARYADALRWSRLAELTLPLLSDPAKTRQATHFGNMAAVYNARGDYPKARELYEQALEIHTRALGPEHPTVASVVNNLASVHHQSGAMDQARVLHERALAIWETTLGPDHPNVAKALNNLANVYRETNAIAQAEPLHERALAIWERALGPDHPDVAKSLNNLGLSHAKIGKYDEAKAVYARALVIWERALGPEHPDVAKALNNLGLVHAATGNYDDATALHERALAIRETALGREHPDVAASLNNLGLVHHRKGAYAEAKALHERALAIWEKALGPDHPQVATSLNNLANEHKATGELDEALALYERALVVLQAAYGPEHPDVGTAIHNIANVHKDKGELAIAREKFERAIAIRQAALGADHLDVASSLVGLAEALLAEHRAADAVAPAEQALSSRDREDVPLDDRVHARWVLAQALRSSGRDRKRAIALAEQARDGLRQSPYPRPEMLAQIETWLRAPP